MEDCIRSWHRKLEKPLADGGEAEWLNWLEESLYYTKLKIDQHGKLLKQP